MPNLELFLYPKMKQTAFLVDGAFFIKRYRHIKKIKNLCPERTAKYLFTMCIKHLEQKDGKYDLYRIIYYDCEPSDKKHHNPITKKAIDFSKTPQYVFQKSLFEELRKQRKIALRLGVLEAGENWMITPQKTKDLFTNKIGLDDLTENDVQLNFSQKQVDLKIGLDIASLALKKQVQQIILVSGDSDFVPAAKMARREGIDFILDPMWNPIKPHLFEHIDGLVSKIETPRSHQNPPSFSTK